MKSATVVRALVHYFAHIGLPSEVLTDRGSLFTVRLLQQVLGEPDEEPLLDNALTTAQKADFRTLPQTHRAVFSSTLGTYYGGRPSDFHTTR
ncbi:UNVERIFIED_CONTAM: hypothetical protein K2H54_045447 [Gekko kuhli]